MLQWCRTRAKILPVMINSRNPTIVMDAQLSVLKVAELEMVDAYTNARALSGTSPHIQPSRTVQIASLLILPLLQALYLTTSS
jgi:hypothetical protein